MKMDIKRDKKFININRKMKINNILLKGILVIIFIILMIILTFIYKTVVSKKINLLLLESTNLSNVKIDSATINDKIDVLNLNKYTDSHRHSGDYRYLFDEICIDVDESDCITSIYSRFDEGKTEITVNDISNITTIDQVEEILGDNYYDGIYDWEQLLNSYVYYDRENNIIAEFVYFNFDEESINNRVLTWIGYYIGNKIKTQFCLKYNCVFY